MGSFYNINSYNSSNFSSYSRCSKCRCHMMALCGQHTFVASEYHDPYQGKHVIMVSGKHNGKRGFVERRVKKKYRVQIEGVPYGLEFFPASFQLADPQPAPAKQ